MNRPSFQLPPRPELIPSEVPDEVRKIAQYGKHYNIRRWPDRTLGEQRKIECALSAFQSFRAERGEAIDSGMWDSPAPDPDTVRIYLAYLRRGSRPWRDASVAALRLYFLHLENPRLFRMVEAPLVRAR